MRLSTLSPATIRGGLRKGFDVLRATLHEQEIRRIIGVPGEGDRVVEGVAPLEAAEDRCLYFINKSVTRATRESLALGHRCIVIAPNGSGMADDPSDWLVLEVADPRAAIAKVLEFIRAEHRNPPWVQIRKIAETAIISPLAVVEGNVEIGEGVVIEPFCTIGPDVVIERGSVLRAGSRIYPRVLIGAESVVRANAVIGADGYGFVRDESGNKTRIPHLGGVITGRHVEIGETSVIEGGTISPTFIEDYAKLAASVFVGHNVRIGRDASITAGVIIAGSAVIGAEAWIGINSSIRDGRRVGADALVGMDVSVQRDLSDNTVSRAPGPDVRIRTDDDRTAIGFT